MKLRHGCRRPLWVHLLVLWAVGIICFGFSGQAMAQDKPVGKIIYVKGNVEYQARGGSQPAAEVKPGEIRPAAFDPSWQKAAYQQPVFAADVFRTSKKSRLRILLEDKSLIALGPNSSFRVESYLVKPEEKLRQGVVNVMHGLSMFIINKSQKHKDSSFRIVTPTANIASRGTQGFLSVSLEMTIAVLRTGFLTLNNADPEIVGQVTLRGMEMTKIARGAAPSEPQQITGPEVNFIESAVMEHTTVALAEGTTTDQSTTVAGFDAGGGAPVAEQFADGGGGPVDSSCVAP